MKRATNNNWRFKRKDRKMQKLKDKHITFKIKLNKQKTERVISDETERVISDQTDSLIE